MATVKKRSWTTASGEKKEAWRVSYTDNHGKRQKKQFALKRDADAFRVTAEGEVAAGIHTADSASITVVEAGERWIKRGEADGLEYGTVKQRRELLNLHIKPLLGREKLSRLTVPKVELFRGSLVETRSRAMAHKAIRALSSILIEAGRQGLVAQNVARNVKVKKKSREDEEVVIPALADLQAMLKASSAPEVAPEARPMIMLAILAGLRSSELRGLRWADVDLKAGEASVRQRADMRGKIGPPKSRAGRRTIPTGSALAAELRAWKLRSRSNSLDLVFPNRAGRPLWQGNLHTFIYLPVQKLAGLAEDTGRVDSKERGIWRAKYGLHCLRHACASRWIDQGINIKKLSVWMGHASIMITLDTYGHLITDRRGDAALVDAAQAGLIA